MGLRGTVCNAVHQSHYATSFPESLPVGIGWVETFNVGIDTGASVDSKDYQVPLPLTGKIDKLTVSLGPEELKPANREMIYGTIRAKQ